MIEGKTIFAVQHNPFIRIGVTYEKNSLLVSVYRTGESTLRTRYYNPSEVTDWFGGNSIKNLEGWRSAYHTSGLKGDDFKRPDSGVVHEGVLYQQVQYRSQRDNARFPSSTCNVTSYAMAFTYYGIPAKEKAYKQMEDNLEYYMYKNGLTRTNHEDLRKMGRAHGADVSFYVKKDLEFIKDNLKRGHLCILSGLFTSSGHIVCVIGYNEKGFIVHDPWGDFNTKYKDYNGESRLYTYQDIERVCITKRSTGAWIHVVRGKL